METKQKTIRDYVAERNITAHTVLLGKPDDDNQWTKQHRLYSVTLSVNMSGSTDLRTNWTCNPMTYMDDQPQLYAAVKSHGLGFGGMRYNPHKPVSVDQAAFNKRCESIVPEHFKADAADVLDSLLSDASGVDQPFEDWASDLGWDTDSRKAERIFHACRESAAKLRQWLGAGEVARLESEYERL